LLQVLGEGEAGRNYTDVEGLGGGNLIDGIAEKEAQSEEVIEIVLGVASGDYDGSIYEVNNGPPVEDHPFGNVVVELLDDNDAAILENIPPPQNQVRFS
jgi:hypothetical protein